MRLAIITSGYFPVIDGVTVSLHERLRRLSAWGHEVLVVAPDYARAARFYPDWARHIGEIFPGITVRSVPSGPFAGLEWESNPTPGAARELEKYLSEFQPEILHIEGASCLRSSVA